MIYCDLDNVLIDSLRLAKRQQDATEALGVPQALYEETARIVMKEFGYYSPQNHHAVLARHLTIGEAFVHKIIECAEEGGIVFPDVHDFLFNFDRSILAILTSGDPEFQMLKIQANDLDAYFSRIHVTIGHKADSLDAPSNEDFFLDDAPREIEKMKLRHPQMFCIQLRQPPFWETQKTTTYADARAIDLLEAAEIIRRQRSM
ncbi:MAG: hypothetical protein Q8Q39_03440 [bacterium]|nr:hypothetical protein [bacterium]